MGRLIDTDALTAALIDAYGLDPERLRDVTDRMPSAQQWIPCSEKLPEKSGLYLVTTPFDRLEPVHSRYFNERGEYSFWSGHPMNEVVAWMPLPTPYKGGQE